MIYKHDLFCLPGGLIKKWVTVISTKIFRSLHGWVMDHFSAGVTDGVSKSYNFPSLYCFTENCIQLLAEMYASLRESDWNYFAVFDLVWESENSTVYWITH